MSTAQEITQKAMDSFLNKNRDLIACLKQKPEEVFQRTSAAASLNKADREEISFFAANVDQENTYARKVAREDLYQAIYATMARAFIKCLTNGAITQAMKLTNEADDQLMELKYIAGTEQRPAPKPVVPVKSAQEQLEDEVIADYNGALSTEKMRAKMNSDVAYRNTYNRLSETNRLESRVTTLHDAGKIGG